MAQPSTRAMSSLGIDLDALHAVLDRLGTRVAGVGAREQAAALKEIGRAEARLAAVKLRLLAEIDRAGTARKAGATDTAAWAARLNHDDTARTHRQVQLATGLQDRSQTQIALADGGISPSHAAVIVDADRKLPESVSPQQRTVVEKDLLTLARSMSPQRLRRAARHALASIEADSAQVDAHENTLVETEEKRAYAAASLTLHDNHDGTITGRFTVPTLQGHLLRKILESMTAPRRERMRSSDTRTEPTDWSHERGLAFCELLEHLPTESLHHKTAATVVVTATLASLHDDLAKVAAVDTGTEVSAGQVRRLACNAGIIPAVLGTGSVPLDLGHQARLFSTAQRIALGTRHETCLADGCERPFAWCELHHHTAWARGGRTDLDNAEPLCWYHHRRIHDPAFDHRRQPDGSIQFHRRT